MSALLSAAGRAFLRAFFAAIAIYSLGVLVAPNLNGIFLLGVTALGASLAAGIRAIQSYIPLLSFARYVGAPYGAWLDSFVQGCLGSVFVVLPGLLDGPNLSFERSAWISLMVGGVTAGIRGVEGITTIGQMPFMGLGFKSPEEPSKPPPFVPEVAEPEPPARKPVVARSHEPPVMSGKPSKTGSRTPPATARKPRKPTK